MTFNIIDLTQALETNMPVYPGSRPVVLVRQASLEKDSFNETGLGITTHTGTHIDCGYHLFPDGHDTLTMPAASFYGVGVVVDCLHLSFHGIITGEHLRQYENGLLSSDFILLNTGWSRFWGTSEYYTLFPVMNEEAATYLTNFSLKGIGIDAGSFDPLDSQYPVHHILLSSGLILIENLVNLEKLPAGGFIFSCLPLKIKKGDGSPVRAVGIIGSRE